MSDIQPARQVLQYFGPAASYRVLIVDDEEVVCLVLREALKEEFALAITGDAESAIPYLVHAPPHVLVVDKNLPGVSGMELLRQVKSLHPDLEVIVITGYASLESSIEAMRAGAYDYLLKPFDDISILVEKVRRAAEKTELARERKQLFNQVLASNHELQAAQQALKRSYMQTLASMATALEARDPYTQGHSERVARMAGEIGRALGLAGTRLDNLVDAARLHDIGKIGIREQILTKPGRLDAGEYEHIKAHPEIGARIIGQMEAYRELVPFIRHHHERVDGRGYPDGLRGEDIPLEARIIAVADTFDAMTSARPYRNPRSTGEALATVRQVSGSQLDADVVRAFLSVQGRVTMPEE